LKLRDLGEFEFIDRITPGCLTGETGHVLLGIGDDAAVIENADGVQLVTTDMLIEGIHFLRETVEPAMLGRKALAVNLSDIAAMGGTPRDALISIAVPAAIAVRELDEFYAGFKELARSTNVNILGGDTTNSKGPLCIAVTVLGVARRDEVLYRSGARLGDRILVTGTLGDAAGGLRVLTDSVDVSPEVTEHLRLAHLSPRLFLTEARIFATSGAVGAAIDLSDGIASDLDHICRASNVAAVLESEAIPISDELRALCHVTEDDPLHLALTGGEDYRLLVTADPTATESLRDRIGNATGCRVSDIGEIVAGEGVGLRLGDGTVRILSETGWDGFRSPT
jgi:thiamine-monophosphate kinase